MLSTALRIAPLAAAPVEQPIAIKLEQPAWFGDFDGMQRRHLLRVLVPYSRTLYFVDLGGAQRGISYDFMRAYDAQLNDRHRPVQERMHVVFIPVSRDRLLPMLIEGYGDVVAANLTITPERKAGVDFAGPAAHDVKEVFVTGPGAPTLNSLDDLAGKEIYVSRATSYYQHLSTLNDEFRRRGLPAAKLREAPGHFETEDILEMANAGLVTVAVADDYLARLWQTVYPHLVVREDLVLHAGGEIAFAIRKGSPLLKASLDEFTATHAEGTVFGNVTLQKYLRQNRWVKNATSEQELHKFQTLVGLFQKYGRQYDVDWLLMAAQGYQESQLDQDRHSAAGAVGVMQLMPETGAKLGVGDIHELEPNIHAGAKYMRFIVDEYFSDERIDAVNKVLFGFASYNAGPNRIRALRQEALRRGLDPNRWFDNVERVAADRVGRETVQYVANIYKYYIAYTLVQENVAAGLDTGGVHTPADAPR